MPRNGYITPSRFADIMTNGRGKDTFGKTALGYADEIVMDILGVERPEFEHTPKSLEWGIENEWLAIETYKRDKMYDVSKPDFIEHPRLAHIGGTPDGLVGTDGIIEVKCPWNSLNHLRNRLELAQLEDYKWQIQGYLWITGREWCDFISFDPRFPAHLQLFIHRVYRDEELVQQLELRCLMFLRIVQERLKQLK